MRTPCSVTKISTSFSIPNLSLNSFGITILPSLSISFIIPTFMIFVHLDITTN